jgi:hypothetical protein
LLGAAIADASHADEHEQSRGQRETEWAAPRRECEPRLGLLGALASDPAKDAPFELVGRADRRERGESIAHRPINAKLALARWTVGRMTLEDVSLVRGESAIGIRHHAFLEIGAIHGVLGNLPFGARLSVPSKIIDLSSVRRHASREQRLQQVFEP